MTGRPSGRAANQMREVSLQANFSPYAEGSCLIKQGNTHVLCCATIEENVPPWMRNSGKGWITAEYGMLPRSTHTRTRREAATGRQSGRTQEIQRLIGRSLRSVVDMELLGERQIRIDCDVLQADGGTRTASITGGWVALKGAIDTLFKNGLLTQSPLIGSVAAVSCGIFQDMCILDLDYAEDSNADADSNFVISNNGKIVEIQGTAEGNPFSKNHFSELLELAFKGCSELTLMQSVAKAED